MSYNVEVNVGVAANPPSGADYPSGTFNFAVSKSRLQSLAVSSAYVLSAVTAFNIKPAGLTSITQMYAKVRGGSLRFNVTSTGGSAQVIPCDTFLCLDTSTEPLTAITVTGTGELEVFFAGS
jgi:hypothetical protein